MDRDVLFGRVADERLRLCDQLETLTAEQWEAGSLCHGWRVRDVLGHLVSLQDLPVWRFVVGVVGLSAFHRRVDRFAREYGERDPLDLVARYRQLAGARHAPPVIGPTAPLTDVVIHGLDLSRPLGLAPAHTDDDARLVLGALCAGMFGFTARRLVTGLRFEATDLGWAQGDGPVVRAAAADLLLAVTGRPIDPAALTGDGTPTLLARLA